MKHILKCTKCEQYTMKDSCPSCKSKCVSSRPAKFSIEDKYAKYRRIAKQEDLIRRGLL